MYMQCTILSGVIYLLDPPQQSLGSAWNVENYPSLTPRMPCMGLKLKPRHSPHPERD